MADAFGFVASSHHRLRALAEGSQQLDAVQAVSGTGDREDQRQPAGAVLADSHLSICL